MSDRLERKVKLSKLPRLLALATVILIVSAGLCGIQFKFQPAAYVTVEGILGAIGLLAGGGLFVGASIGALVILAIRLVKSRKDEP